jgi:hypothetical protein
VSHTCKAGALPLEPHLQSILLWVMCHQLFLQVGGSGAALVVRLELLLYLDSRDCSSVSHSVNVSSLGCNSLSVSKPWFSAIRCLTFLTSPCITTHVLLTRTVMSVSHCHGDEYLRYATSREERFVLACGFRYFSLEHMAKGSLFGGVKQGPNISWRAHCQWPNFLPLGHTS